MANKVNFGLKNVHYAVITETVQSDGSIKSTYGTPKAWPGAVSLNLAQSGSSSDFYADDRAYYHLNGNAGYDGTIETAKIPDEMLTEVFGQIKDSTSKNVAEFADIEAKYVALMFEVNGDESARKYCFYRVSIGRPEVAAETATDAKAVKTQTCNISASARPDDYVIKTFADADSTNYANFYESVPEAPARAS